MWSQDDKNEVHMGTQVGPRTAGGGLRNADRELVETFLRHVEGLSQSEVGRRVPGVTQRDVSRWQNGEFHALTQRKRASLERYLELLERAGEVRESFPTPEDLRAEIFNLCGGAPRNLEPFLSRLSDHDLIATCREIASFRSWPEAKRNYLEMLAVALYASREEEGPAYGPGHG